MYSFCSSHVWEMARSLLPFFCFWWTHFRIFSSCVISFCIMIFLFLFIHFWLTFCHRGVSLYKIWFSAGKGLSLHFLLVSWFSWFTVVLFFFYTWKNKCIGMIKTVLPVARKSMAHNKIYCKPFYLHSYHCMFSCISLLSFSTKVCYRIFL